MQKQKLDSTVSVNTTKALSSTPTCRLTPTRLFKQRLKILSIFILSLYIFAQYLTPAMPHDGELSKYTSSIFLPYTHKFNTRHIPMVRATIGRIDFELPMDTGSTGLMIGAPRLPDVGPDEGVPAYEYLSSSRILYSGRLVNQSITFHGADGEYAIAKVPILVVDRSVVCPWYKPGVDGFDCPRTPDRPYPEFRDTSQITYMGIGFGRNRLGDNKQKALPSGNPFLNIESINGTVLPAGSLRTGYTISTQGVHIGLTKENARGFVFTNLDPGATHSSDPRDWAMVKMSFQLNGQKKNYGSALIDTGIRQMYLRTDIGVETPNVTVRNPNKKGHARYVKRVKPGTDITINFPISKEGETVGYSFEVGRGAPMEPAYVVPEKQAPPPYVNTGRNFLFGYSVAFDADGGRFGFRAVEPKTLHRAL